MRTGLARKLAMLLVFVLATFGTVPLRACPTVRPIVLPVTVPVEIARVQTPFAVAAHCGMEGEGAMACCPTPVRSPETVRIASGPDAVGACPCSVGSADLLPARADTFPAFVFAALPPAPATVIQSFLLRSGSSPEPGSVRALERPPRPDRGRAPPGASA